MDLIELLFDWISAAMLAEYEVYTNTEVKNSTKTTIRIDSDFDLQLAPKITFERSV